MKSIIIVQARTNSTRLPGKVLLPVGGMPLVVLAVRRAANQGRKVIVATSNEPSDDVLVEMLTNAGIQFHRGSLENVLDRMVGALAECDDDTLVFRLTADNVFPDGALLDQMEEEFIKSGFDYLCCNGYKSGLPYGMSAELTRVRYLRAAAANTQSTDDQEHVTPYIRRVFGEVYFDRYEYMNKGHLRCTVDCLDDYFVIQHVFSGITDPVRISAFDLIDRLQNAPYQQMYTKAANKLVLGTAQLGLNYGIANQSGKPEYSTAEQLIKTAIVNGAIYLDTARVYGDSEAVIGNALKSGFRGRVQIITKLDPLKDCPAFANKITVNAFVDASVFHSCASLRTQALDVLLLHRASHLSDWSGAVWSRLLEHKAEGRLKTLGVSVQNPEELKEALATTQIEFIQMPFNVLDWRWDALIPIIREIKLKRALVIHVRSALLQGLLPSTESSHWFKANVSEPAPIIAWLRSQCAQAERFSVADFCLSFVKSLDWVDGVVVGMENSEQLAENIKTFSNPDITNLQMQNIQINRIALEPRTLDPAAWGIER